MKPSSTEAKSKKIQETILNCNKLAMDHLQHQNFQSCIDLLQKAEEVLESSSNKNLKAITFNNLGCYYKQIGKLDQSLNYLQKALDWSPIQPSDRCNLASTHLNICAIKSRMGKHQSALQNAQKALKILRQTKKTIPLVQNTTIIAIHNIAIQNEFLSRIPTSLKAYKQALQKAQTQLGPSHQLTISINSSFLALSDTQKFFEMRVFNRRRQAKTSSPATRNTPIYFGLPNIRNGSIPKTQRELTAAGRSSIKRKALRTAPGKRTKILQEIKKPVRPKTYYSETHKDKIQQKLNSLQSQLKSFEDKYQKLELKHHKFISSAHQSPSPVKILPIHLKAHSFSVPFSSDQVRARKAAVDIQRVWRGYKGRLEYKGRKRLRAQIKAQKAIQDFQAFKREVLQENFYQIPEIQRPRTNQRPNQRMADQSLAKTTIRFFDRKFMMDLIPESQQNKVRETGVFQI